MKPKEKKKIIYSILKEILEGESIPTANDYNLTREQFLQIIRLMKEEGYINPKRVSFYITGTINIEKSLDTVTEKGWKFLEENNAWAKIYKGIKEFSTFIP